MNKPKSKAPANVDSPGSEADFFALKPSKEQRAIELARLIRGIDSPKVARSDEDGKLHLAVHESCNAVSALGSATASGSKDFYDLIIDQLSGLSSSLTEINAGLAFMRGLEPKDELEALLISQMFAANLMAMQFAARALKQQNYELAELNVNRFNKLTRRFTEQMDALNKHRGKGQQKVTVEHVTVNAGGQAIVGNVERGEGENGKAEK